MFKKFVLALLILIVGCGIVYAQSPDSMIITNDIVAPGDTAEIKLFLRNTQFSVGGFSSRFVLENYEYATFSHVERGEDVANFEMFFANVNDSSCRVNGIADMPGGNSVPPLPLGYHELATIFIVVSDTAPLDIVDSVVFENDSLPPNPNTAISDSTGLISEVPTLINGSVTFETQVGIDDNSSIIPNVFELSQNYPNPFNAETTIEFSVNNFSHSVSLAIFDVIGNQIKRFYWDTLNPGNYSVRWDGLSESGNPISSGIYFYALADNTGRSQTRKMTLLK